MMQDQMHLFTSWSPQITQNHLRKAANVCLTPTFNSDSCVLLTVNSTISPSRRNSRRMFSFCLLDFGSLFLIGCSLIDCTAMNGCNLVCRIVRRGDVLPLTRLGESGDPLDAAYHKWLPSPRIFFYPAQGDRAVTPTDLSTGEELQFFFTIRLQASCNGILQTKQTQSHDLRQAGLCKDESDLRYSLGCLRQQIRYGAIRYFSSVA
ncbi:hypothetical protein T11_17531 [Trichinella zimbabwensis]|uniref:Uncharacterized protein n=1 Tax=Trichinella zimbabwensis TaxID=268475 RepID=A0A0V1I6U9_9BILA|nr:hypothetical protein T11_17531 [Trichinella zimbabwensis]